MAKSNGTGRPAPFNATECLTEFCDLCGKPVQLVMRTDDLSLWLACGPCQKTKPLAESIADMVFNIVPAKPGRS